ncbi:hypothetical protein G2W53_027129 [Senna tora]|uniref:Uncharacterized protein n=1 Tax=Senna tora TaxID=362788 RepID=A0A834WLY7_9FABA|nr:hypothetical protein G2W53_027129 [Senna tora]
MIPWFGTPASCRAVILGFEGLASRLLAVVACIGCHSMETTRSFGLMIPWFGTPASRGAVIMGTEELASRLLAVVAGIGCLIMKMARPFGEALECIIILGDSQERSHEVIPVQRAIKSSGVHGCGYWWRIDVNGCPFEIHALRCSIISTGSLHLLVCLCAHGMWFVLVVLVDVGINSLGVVMIAEPMPLCCVPNDAEVVFIKYVHPSRSSNEGFMEDYPPGITPGRGVGGATSKEDCCLVGLASSHILVSKIKPCMFKKLIVGPRVGSIGPPLVCTGRLVPSAGDALLVLIGRVVPLVLLL